MMKDIIYDVKPEIGMGLISHMCHHALMQRRLKLKLLDLLHLRLEIA